MTANLAAICLEGINTDHFRQWLAEGLLPNIAAVFTQGAQGEVHHQKRFRNERCWDIFLAGRDLASCGAQFLPGSYDFFNESLQREERYTPFYDLGDDVRVCVFDLPVTPSPAIPGIQISGWGSELNASSGLSLPEGLLAELRHIYGTDPKLTRSIKVFDHQTREEEYSYVLPSSYDVAALEHFKRQLLTAVERRTAIALDLLARDAWDLFLMAFVEAHTANHSLWHFGETHPLAALVPGAPNAQLEIYQAIDRAIGSIAEALPEEATLMVFSLDHTTANSMDVPSMALLPELLYRWNFPDHQALAVGDIHQPVPAPRTNYGAHWKHEVWATATAEGRARLLSPEQLEAQGHPLSWHTAVWYQPLWPSMTAFALPTVSDGHVRINVRGREASGLVEPEDFSAVLAQVSQLLERAVNPRSGQPMVKQLIATRTRPEDCPAVPPDLIVCWNDQFPAETLDSPDCGRIGPLPYFRTGGHVSHGTDIANPYGVRGPGIAAGTLLPPGRLEDLAATLIHLAGAIPGAHIQGRNLFSSTP